MPSVLSSEAAKHLLRQYGLRGTKPRIAVLRVLAAQSSPQSHSDMVRLLAGTELDPATVYRNLQKLVETNIAEVVSRAGGIARYTLKGEAHNHAHFACDECGEVSCLPDDVFNLVERADRWQSALQSAAIQFRGECPTCREGT